MKDQHPNRGSRVITEAMLRARMAYEMEDLRDTLKAAIRERDEARAEVTRQRAEIEKLRAEIDGLEAELSLRNSVEISYRAMGGKP